MVLVPPYEGYGGHYTVGTLASGFNTDYVNVRVIGSKPQIVRTRSAETHRRHSGGRIREGHAPWTAYPRP
jgi:hypothetical protein